MKNAHNPCFVGVQYTVLLYNHFSINNHLNQYKKTEVILCFQWFQLDPDPAIFCYGSGSREMIRIPRIRIRHTAVQCTYENLLWLIFANSTPVYYFSCLSTGLLYNTIQDSTNEYCTGIQLILQLHLHYQYCNNYISKPMIYRYPMSTIGKCSNIRQEDCQKPPACIY